MHYFKDWAFSGRRGPVAKFCFEQKRILTK
jgi:hypothetical protein